MPPPVRRAARARPLGGHRSRPSCRQPFDSTSSSAEWSTSTRNRDRSTGSMVRLSMLSSAAASEASPPPDSARRPARRRRACVKARLVAGTRSRALTAPAMSAAGADPGQSEGCWRDVVGVGARADRVEGLGHIVLAAGLAGDGESQLRRELARHLTVGRVERALRLGCPLPGEGDETGHPDGAPLPRVVHQQRVHRLVDPLVAAGLQRGSSLGEQHLGLFAGALSRADSRWTGSSMLTVRSHGICGSLSSARSVGRSCQSRESSETIGTSKSREEVECSAAPPRSRATTSRSTPRSWTRSSSADTKRSAGSGAHALSSSRYSESCFWNSGVSSIGGSELT